MYWQDVVKCLSINRQLSDRLSILFNACDKTRWQLIVTNMTGGANANEQPLHNRLTSSTVVQTVVQTLTVIEMLNRPNQLLYNRSSKNTTLRCFSLVCYYREGVTVSSKDHCPNRFYTSNEVCDV